MMPLSNSLFARLSMNRLLAAAITAVLATSFTGAAHATDPPLPPNVATQSLRSASIDTTVIDRAAIEASGATDLVELLRLQPGVDLRRQGGSSRITRVLLRGANARQVLVLIDGARVASAGSSEFDFASLALDQIERIEILRGPRSAEFGSDALGGVIRIATRVPTTDSARIYAGRYDRRGGSASAAFSNDASSFGLTVGGESYDGSLRAPTGTLLSNVPVLVDHGSVQRNLSLVARTTLGDQQLTASARHTGGTLRSEDAAVGHLETDPDLSLTGNQSLSVELGGPQLPGWSHQLLVTVSRDRLETRNTDFFLDDVETTRTEVDGRRESIDWRNRLALSEPLELLFGAHADWAATDRHFRSSTVGPDASSGSGRNPGTSTPASDSSRASAASVGLHYGADGLDAEFDLRHDHLRGFGGETTPGLSLGWQLHPALQTSFRYSEGFRAASLDERTLSGLADYGYPDVEPEHVRTLEAGLQAQLGEQQRIDIAAFRSRYDDLLIRQYSSGYPRPGIDEARADGVELDYSLWSGPWALAANATVQGTRGRNGITGAGRPLAFHPRQKAAMQLAYRIDDDLRLGTELFASSPRVAEPGDTTSPLNDTNPSRFGRMPGYALINLHAAWMPAAAWRVDLRLDNVADRRSERVRSGYAQPAVDYASGRAWFASVRWAMP